MQPRSPHKIAQEALAQLQEAVLQSLFLAFQNDHTILTTPEVSDRTGLPSARSEHAPANAVASAVLSSLLDQAKITLGTKNAQFAWVLTSEEITARRAQKTA